MHFRPTSASVSLLLAASGVKSSEAVGLLLESFDGLPPQADRQERPSAEMRAAPFLPASCFALHQLPRQCPEQPPTLRGDAADEHGQPSCLVVQTRPGHLPGELG